MLLLWPGAAPQAPRAAAGALAATLRVPARTAPPARAVPEPVAVPVTAPLAVPARRAPPAVPRDRSASVVTAAAAAVEAPAAGAIAAGPPPPAAAMLATAAAAPVEALDPQTLNAYRIALARAARGQQRYPSLARERGWAGQAEVRVDVGRGGAVPDVRLARSSGHDLLDREAVGMLARAAAATPVPDALRARAFEVVLPVVFDLAEP